MKIESAMYMLLISAIFPASFALAEDTPPAKLKLRDPSAVQATAGAEGKPNADPTTGMEFVFVKGGCYKMGSNVGRDDEKPLHEVCVSDFHMGK